MYVLIQSSDDEPSIRNIFDSQPTKSELIEYFTPYYEIEEATDIAEQLSDDGSYYSANGVDKYFLQLYHKR